MEEETGWKEGREGKTSEDVSVLCVSACWPEAQLSVRRKKEEERERRRVRRKKDERERRRVRRKEEERERRGKGEDSFFVFVG